MRREQEGVAMRTMKHFAPHQKTPRPRIGSKQDPRRRERGFTTFGVLVLFILLMGVAAMISAATTQTTRAERRDDDNQNEYWTANGNAEPMEAALKTDLPQIFERDVRAARQYAGLRPLPAF